MKFSVLMSLYNKENPIYFENAMQSIWNNQIKKPNEIVLVLDGPLTKDLYYIVNRWKNNLKEILNVIVIKENIGLALALNEGLKHCSYEYIARMDTDDISTSNRFYDQIEFFKQNINIDVCGMFICEINENNEIIKDVVEYPIFHNELFRFFQKRVPFAHPTVMFKKCYFEKAGYYENTIKNEEDTLLWYKGFLNNCKFQNIPTIGLKYRRSSDFYKRRSDLSKSLGLLKYRIMEINKNLHYGMISNFYAFIYFLLMISPLIIKKLVYKLCR